MDDFLAFWNNIQGEQKRTFELALFTHLFDLILFYISLTYPITNLFDLTPIYTLTHLLI